MKVVEGEVAQVFAYVLTGDGPRDLRVLKAVAEKYDHSKVLKVPESAMRRPTGLTAVMRALALSFGRTNVRIYLIVIDREHVGWWRR